MVVCGFMFGPPAEQGRIEPISSASLAAYLLGATMIVLASLHADPALIVFAAAGRGTLVVAWRAPAATGAVAAAAAFVVRRVRRMGGARQSGHAGAAGRSAARHRPRSHRRLRRLASDHGRDLRGLFGGAGFLAQGRSTSAIIPVVWSAAGGVRAARAVDRALRPHRASRSLDPVRDPGGAAGCGLWRRDRDPRPGATAGRDLPISIALFATGTLGALALALTFALEKGWLTIALALMSMGTAWISMQRPIPFLRWLAAILAGDRGAARSATSRASSATRSAPPRSSTGCSGATAFRRPSFWIGKLLPAPPRRRCAAAGRWRRRRSCSRCCWRSWKSATPSTAATCTAPFPRSRSSRCRSASRSRWRSAWNGCASAPAASFTMSARWCSRLSPGSRACSVCCCWKIPSSGRPGRAAPSSTCILLGYALPAVLMLLLSYAVAGRRRDVLRQRASRRAR